MSEIYHLRPVYFYKVNHQQDTRTNTQTHNMLQQLALFDPSLEYYCHSCRKPLKHSVRIIAKTTDFECYLDFCPPCLAHQSYVDKVQDYYISKKVGVIFREMSNVTAPQLLETISTVQKEGIEQMFLRGLKSSDRQFKIYEQLNKQVFRGKNQSLSVSLGQTKIPIGGTEKEKQNPPNRKHLKTLGYNWERQEFSFQPEVVFGYLMGCLQEQAEATQDQIQLRNIIYNYYTQEVQIINDVKQFLIDSPFLLARKAIFDIEQVPKQLTELKNIEAEIKELIISICNMTIDEEQPQQNNDSSLNKHGKHGERVKNRKHKKNKKQRDNSQSSARQDKDHRERTRQRKEKKKHKHSPPQQVKAQPNNQLSKPQQLSKKPEHVESGSDCERGETKRKRGRPKGSKSTVKVVRRRGKSRVFELKMDIENKISQKREKPDIKELQQESESLESRKRRKLNEQSESSWSQSQNQQADRNEQSSDEE